MSEDPEERGPSHGQQGGACCWRVGGEGEERLKLEVGSVSVQLRLGGLDTTLVRVTLSGGGKGRA